MLLSPSNKARASPTGKHLKHANLAYTKVRQAIPLIQEEKDILWESTAITAHLRGHRVDSVIGWG